MSDPHLEMVDRTYKRIRRELLLQPLRPQWIPIHITDEKFSWCGSGTLVLDWKGRHRRIITASHLFRVGHRTKYWYQILQPYSEQAYPITSAAPMENVKEDVAVCFPGPQRFIEGFSNYQSGPIPELAAYQGHPTKMPHPVCISSVTGRKFAVGGILENESKGRYYVIDYAEGFYGESGTGFFLPNQKELLVLRGGFDACDKLKQDFHLTSDKLCLAALIELG